MEEKKTPGPTYKKRFLLKHGQRLIVIETNDISYFYSEGRFVFLITKNNQKYVTPYKLEELLALLNPSEFFRINRSWMISFSSVGQIHPYFGHRLKLHLKPATETEIIVSRERVNDFKAWLEE
jgi:two-component system, LytTR family, response regulator LytT